MTSKKRQQIQKAKKEHRKATMDANNGLSKYAKKRKDRYAPED